MNLTLNISKKHLVAFVLLVGLFFSLGFALAGINPSLPNHEASQVSLTSGKSLQEAI